jgi:pectate lyase
VKNVRIKDVKVGSVKKFVKKVSNVENVVEKNVTYQMEGNKD